MDRFERIINYLLKVEGGYSDDKHDKGGKTKYIEISEEGLELIEMVSLDCTSAEGIWYSDEEIKINKLGYIIENGIKTKKFWDGKIKFAKKPLRIKIRNISGDEMIFNIK